MNTLLLGIRINDQKTWEYIQAMREAKITEEETEILINLFKGLEKREDCFPFKPSGFGCEEIPIPYYLKTPLVEKLKNSKDKANRFSISFTLEILDPDDKVIFGYTNF